MTDDDEEEGHFLFSSFPWYACESEWVTDMTWANKVK